MRNCKYCNIELSNKQKGLKCTTCKNGMDRYNMHRNDMITLYETQNKQCALCGKYVILFSRRQANSAYIDHNHITGKVRAIVCHPCNIAIGYIESKLSIDTLLKYLNVPVA